VTVADLVFVNGLVHTLVDGAPPAEAVAVAGGRILAVGDTASVRELAVPGAEVVDLAGRVLLPGIHDGHIHLADWARQLPQFSVDVTTATTLDQVRRAVADRVAELPPGSWVRGHGWYEGRIAEFRDGRPPTRQDLDAVSPDHPVVLGHFSEHGAWANSAALARAGVTADTPDPEGGTITRDAAGEPTGWLVESAKALVLRAVPAMTEQERNDALVAGMAELNRRGVTSVTDPMVSADLARCYQSLAADGKLSLRVAMLLHWAGLGQPNHAEQIRRALSYSGASTGLGDEWLRVAGAKLFIDGIPALRTAWLSRPYAHGCETGSLVTDGASDDQRYAQVEQMVALLHRARLQAQVHATGDRACDAAVDAFVRAMRDDPWPDARHALIHANLLSERTARTMAEHGFCVNLNSLIKWNVGDKLDALYGDERAGYTMPMRTLIDAGVHVADTSDAPVVDPDWRQAVRCMVERTTRGSGRVSGPEQRVSRLEALRAWTIEAAYQEHTDHLKGTIEPGKLADLVVLDGDPLTVPEPELPELPVAMTYVGGARVHAA
jgi:predicted amidohydrolase YtcJ